MGVFTNAILPISGIAAVGYLLARTTDIDIGPINMLGLYVLIPALAFHSIATTTLGGGEVLKLGPDVIGYSLLMIVITWGVGRLADESGPLLGALMLAAMFPNSGFVGIPLSGFAFGKVGRTTAVIYLTIQNVVVYTLGVYIASNGSDAGALGVVTEIFRLSLLYAIVADVVARALGVVPPADAALMETIGLVGDTSIPMMSLILGIQLAETDVPVISRSIAPSALKLVVVPPVGFGLAFVLSFGDPTVAKVFVLECATPTAVIPLAFTIEYADEMTVGGITAPEYLSTTIFTTTVVSVGILTVLVAVLQAGVLF